MNIKKYDYTNRHTAVNNMSQGRSTWDVDNPWKLRYWKWDNQTGLDKELTSYPTKSRIIQYFL